MMDIATGWPSLRKKWNSKVTIQSGIVDLGQFDLALSVRWCNWTMEDLKCRAKDCLLRLAARRRSGRGHSWWSFIRKFSNGRQLTRTSHGLDGVLFGRLFWCWCFGLREFWG